MRVGRRTVTVVTPAAKTTTWGLGWLSLHEADGATRDRVRDCNVQPKGVDVALAGVTIHQVGATVYAPAGSGIGDSNAVEIDDISYAVDGPPSRLNSRSGRGRVIIVDLIPWDRLAPFWRHSVIVERFTGNGPSGPTFAAAETVTGFAQPGNRLVLSSTGEEVVSSATICFPLLTEPIPPGSYLTPPPSLAGRRSRAITSAALSGAGLDTADHLEVTLR